MRKILILSLVFFLYGVAFAKDIENYDIKIYNHKFLPEVVKASSGKVIKLHIFNKDSTVEEFESFDLKREKIVPGNKKIVVVVGPLKPGEYHFFGEFHQETAQGKLIVK